MTHWFTLFLFLLSFCSFAENWRKIENNETFDQFVSRNIIDYEIQYKNDTNEFKKDIIRWNASIKDWSNLKNGTAIYTGYPFPSYVQGSEYSQALINNIYQIEEEQNFSLFGFYSNTFGSYTESTIDQVVKSGQNFPITLGLAASKANLSKTSFINSSIYWAKPTSGAVSGTISSNKTISIPGELGFNLYYQYYLKKSKTGFYTGYDYENLNTFNTDQLLLGSTVENISNKMHYATIGVGQSMDYGNFILSTKLSFSKSLFSSTNSTSGKNLTGHKYLLYISFRPNGRLSYNILYKHHDLKGPTDLSINRFGLSLGFQFF